MVCVKILIMRRPCLYSYFYSALCAVTLILTANYQAPENAVTTESCESH